MGKSNRQWAQDKLKASVNAADNSIAHLEPVIKTYEKDHADIAQILTMAQLVMREARDMVQRLSAQF